MENAKESLSFKFKIMFPLIIIFLVSIFNFPQPQLKDLKIIDDAQISESPKLMERRKGSDWIKIKIGGTDSNLKIQNHNFYQCNKESILLRLKKGDYITVGLRKNHIFYLNFNNEELTNLEKANEGRRQVQIWGFCFPLVCLFLTLLPSKDTKHSTDLNINIVISSIILTITILLLCEFVGTEHLF